MTEDDDAWHRFRDQIGSVDHRDEILDAMLMTITFYEVHGDRVGTIQCKRIGRTSMFKGSLRVEGGRRWFDDIVLLDRYVVRIEGLVVRREPFPLVVGVGDILDFKVEVGARGSRT